MQVSYQVATCGDIENKRSSSGCPPYQFCFKGVQRFAAALAILQSVLTEKFCDSFLHNSRRCLFFSVPPCNSDLDLCVRVLPSSEIELQRQLQLPGIVDRRGDHAKVASAYGCIRPLKLGMVEDIEGLGAELAAQSFMQPR